MKIKDIKPFVKNNNVCATGYIKKHNLNRTTKKVFEKYYRIGRKAKRIVLADYLTSKEVEPYVKAINLYCPPKELRVYPIFNFHTHKVIIKVRSNRNTPSLEAIYKVEFIYNEHPDTFHWQELYLDLVKIINGDTNTFYKFDSISKMQSFFNNEFRNISLRYNKSLHKIDKVTKHRRCKGKHRKVQFKKYGNYIE